MPLNTPAKLFTKDGHYTAQSLACGKVETGYDADLFMRDGVYYVRHFHICKDHVFCTLKPARAKFRALNKKLHNGKKASKP